MVGISSKINRPIGLKVPQATCTTMEIRSDNEMHLREYANIHRSTDGNLAGGYDKEQEAQLRSIQVRQGTTTATEETYEKD